MDSVMRTRQWLSQRNVSMHNQVSNIGKCEPIPVPKLNWKAMKTAANVQVTPTLCSTAFVWTSVRQKESGQLGANGQPARPHAVLEKSFEQEFVMGQEHVRKIQNPQKHPSVNCKIVQSVTGVRGQFLVRVQ